MTIFTTGKNGNLVRHHCHRLCRDNARCSGAEAISPCRPVGAEGLV